MENTPLLNRVVELAREKDTTLGNSFLSPDCVILSMLIISEEEKAGDFEPETENERIKMSALIKKLTHGLTAQSAEDQLRKKEFSIIDKAASRRLRIWLSSEGKNTVELLQYINENFKVTFLNCNPSKNPHQKTKAEEPSKENDNDSEKDDERSAEREKTAVDSSEAASAIADEETKRTSTHVPACRFFRKQYAPDWAPAQ